MSDPTPEELRQLVDTWTPQADIQGGVTVGQLRGILGLYPDNMVIVVASDEEGNSFDLLSRRMSPSWYMTDGPCRGEVASMDPDDEDGPFTPEPGDLPALIIGP